MGNSIYEYYDKTDSRYYLLQEKQGKRMYSWEPSAREIDIPGFTEFDFFLINEGQGKNKLCEGISGGVIINQAELPHRHQRRYSQYNFIRILPELIEENGGRAALNQAIVNFIFEHDQEISPRYKAKKV
jgi:hypothetical protein